jgi:MFS family permease
MSVMTADKAENVDGVHSDQSEHHNNAEKGQHSISNGGSELEGLTLYEKKALLVNRELDSMGMGRYQWTIFFLCGFGYLLDLMWAQTFGLITTPLQNELGFSDTHLSNISISFSSGLCAGAFVWGNLVDFIGRQWAFNLTVFIASIFGLALGSPDTYSAFLVLTAFTGFGIGGNIPIDTTIMLEFLPQNRRWLLAALSLFQPLGVIISSAIAYGFIPTHSCASDLHPCNSVPDGAACCTKQSNYGWRYYTYTVGAITLFIFFLRFVVFRFQESPKFLIYRGKDEKAVSVLQRIAKVNKLESKLTLEDLQSLTDDASSTGSDSSRRPILGDGVKQAKASLGARLALEFDRYKMLFSSSKIARLTILVWVVYAFDYWSFTIAGSFLPTVLARKNQSIGVSLVQTYRGYVYIYLFGIPGVLLGCLVYRGRWISMLISSALMGASLCIFAAVSGYGSYIGINGVEYFFQSMFNAILYGWTPEAFPAPIRGTACGVASFWGRLFSIISPLIAGHVLASSVNGVLYLGGAGAFVATVAIAFMPRKMIGEQSF